MPIKWKLLVLELSKHFFQQVLRESSRSLESTFKLV